MKNIADVKQKIMECLMEKDLSGMSMEELNLYVEIAGKASAIQEKDFMEGYTEILKSIAAPKGCGTLGTMGFES